MSSDTVATVDPRLRSTTDDLGPLTRLIRPLVDAVARIRATLHAKLLAGFLIIAVLLLSMGVLSIVVLGRINAQVDALIGLNDQTMQAQEMIYAVTAQSHYRAMALLTNDPEYIDKIADAKERFTADLASVRTYAIAPPRFFDELVDTDVDYRLSSEQVTRLYRQGQTEAALALHIEQEHAISHELEDALNTFIDDSQQLVEQETASLASHRRFLTIAVASFSGGALLVALLLGAVLSWSVIRPVRRVDGALERIAGGDFETRVDVPNRDEFGTMTHNLNRTTEQLSSLYAHLETLNTSLQDTVDAKVQELERVSRLKRYLSPSVAESIVTGERDVSLAPRRKFLTTFFSDIRGFTQIAERMEPDELVEQMNAYLTEMTEIVFRNGGTLDKIVGDALMVFFGDPIPQQDHAARAVRMAFEMRERLEKLDGEWANRFKEPFRMGYGISTGWVTVGDIGSPTRIDYTVLGNEVNLASRLADHAEAGQILVTEATLEEVADLVVATPLEAISLHGVSRVVHVYAVEPRST
ncbi:MAG TPA: adenylate/guanylate cyclase domain-containing protein [Actinomycetota bacterium]|jgi:class 3 adenylate cyclase